jgi:uncharacterized YccA/Bax inhibitor family protein
MNPKEIVETRPAETGGLAAAIVVLIAYFSGLDDPAVIAALTVIVGAIPGVITKIVSMRRQQNSVVKS